MKTILNLVAVLITAVASLAIIALGLFAAANLMLIPLGAAPILVEPEHATPINLVGMIVGAWWATRIFAALASASASASVSARKAAK